MAFKKNTTTWKTGARGLTMGNVYAAIYLQYKQEQSLHSARALHLVTYLHQKHLQRFHVPFLQSDGAKGLIHQVQLPPESRHLPHQTLLCVAVVVRGDETLNVCLEALNLDREIANDVEPLEVAVVAWFAVGNPP